MPGLTTEERRALRLRRRRRRILVRRLVALALLAAVALVAVGFSFAGSPGVLPAGAAVAGVDLAGMRQADALRSLESRARHLAHRPVAFVAGDATMRLSAAQLGVRADWRRAVSAVADSGDGFGPFRGLRRLKLRLLGGTEVEPALAWYGSAVDYAVDTLARKVSRRPVNARLARRGGRFVVVEGRAGRVLDRDAARARVVAALAALVRPSQVRLPVVPRQPAVRGADLRGALADARTAVARPVRLVQGDSTVTIQPREMQELVRLPRGGGRTVAIGGRYAERWLASLADRVARPARDADWAVSEGGAVRVVPAAAGVTLDVAATVEALERAAFAGGARTARARVRVVPPRRTTAEARALGLETVVSEYTTTYGGTPGRLHNVQLVADLVDGALVAPGATFSFNGVTGERNASKGFEEAPVIINGELQNGIGGGVCQVSTTVFNAAFEAGLPIASRTNHALYISHYPLGRDATVNYPDIDLRFVNDTPGWMLVRTRVGAGALTVQLLGTSPHRRVETDTTPLEVIGKVPFQVVRDPTLPRRTRIVERYGTHPLQTSVRRRVYDANGTLVSDRTWWSTYVGEPTVVRIGTREPDPAPVTPKAVPTPKAPAAETAAADEGAAATPAIPAPTDAPRP